jgi:coproporphyrinogen III oxidase-like Fe-S oxidoreductase
MTQGVRISEYKSLVGADLPRERVERLLDLGAIKIMDDTLQTTFAGRLVLNEVIRQLID